MSITFTSLLTEETLDDWKRMMTQRDAETFDEITRAHHKVPRIWEDAQTAKDYRVDEFRMTLICGVYALSMVQFLDGSIWMRGEGYIC